MPTIKRGDRVYYYKSRRVGGRVVNRLVATGPMAEFLAEESRLERARRSDAAAEARDRRADRRAVRCLRAEMDEMDRPIVEAVELAMGAAMDAARAALAAAGYRNRRGEWRRPRGVRTMAEDERLPTLAELLEDVVGNDPRASVRIEDGRPVVDLVQDDPGDRAAKERRISRHLEKAWSGDPSERDTVRRAFRRFADHDARPPDGTVANRRDLLPVMIASYGGLPQARAEAAIVERLSRFPQPGLYTQEAIRITLQSFKDDLLGPNPTAIERVLVDSIACSWLDWTDSMERAAKPKHDDQVLLDHLERRKDRATKRLQSGLKSLALVRRKLAPTTAIQVNMGIPGPDAARPLGSKGMAPGLEAESAALEVDQLENDA